MINAISSNQIGNIDLFSTLDSRSNVISTPTKNLKSYDQVSPDILDNEAQEIFSAVNNDLNMNISEASSIHNKLSYSKVMSLLEGL